MPSYVVEGTVEYNYKNIIDADDMEHLGKILEDMAEEQTLNTDSLNFIAVDSTEIIEDEDRACMFQRIVCSQA